jgi:hypothetical protein
LATSRVGDQRVDIGGGRGRQVMLVRQGMGLPFWSWRSVRSLHLSSCSTTLRRDWALARWRLDGAARRELPLVAAVVVDGQDVGVLLVGEQAVVAGAGHLRDGGGAGVEATHRIGRIQGAVLHEHDVAG